MKAKIDEKGLLHLERSNRLKLQYCPFTEPGTGCGDWCPLFENDYYNGAPCVWLRCGDGKSFHLDEIIDERSA